jgi:para-nitrobenzyl esterase
MALSGCGQSDASSAVNDTTQLRRTTDRGDVIGTRGSHESLSWIGIPYAAPPMGDLRWRAPRAHAPWNEVRSTQAFGPRCPQMAYSDNSFQGDEDCLYLNIWTPTPSREKRPVMVWVHGGGNNLGSADGYDGGLIATSQNVVVVTINYRLGVFGWFRHPALRDASASDEDRSGNFGTLDIIRALRWVQDNIGAFGGDAANVTLFGESAGAVDVFSVLASPKAAGLYHRAISQTGRPHSIPAETAENYADAAAPGLANSSSEVLLRLLIADGRAADRQTAKAEVAAMGPAKVAAYLRGKTYLQLNEVYAAIAGTKGRAPNPVLFRDGAVLPLESISEAFASGKYNKVPFIVGTTRDDGSLPMGSSRLIGRVPGTPGGKVENRSLFLLEREYASKLMKAGWADEPAMLMSRHQPGQIFVYRLDWDDNVPSPSLDQIPFGASHGMDLPFVFGLDGLTTEVDFKSVIRPQSLADAATLSSAVMSYWGEFARTGAPGNGGRNDLPRWTAWNVAKGSTSFIIDKPGEGGLSMLSTPTTKASVFAELRGDARIGSMRERCEILRDLVRMDATSLQPVDYREFARGECPALLPF